MKNPKLIVEFHLDYNHDISYFLRCYESKFRFLEYILICHCILDSNHVSCYLTSPIAGGDPIFAWIKIIPITIDPLSDGLVTPPLRVEKLRPRLSFFDNMFSFIT